MIKTQSNSNILATEPFLKKCLIANNWRKQGLTFKEIATLMNTSESSARRAYYGIHHHRRPGKNYTQIRIGSSVPIS